jgi:cyclopropane fatty-acyl-phospholipid synthase-like methyltransferase
MPLLPHNRFMIAYEGQPPWDIPGPQPVVVAQQAAGAIGPRVLDVGCGTGENALFLATRGHTVWGLDFVPVAIDRARARASARKLYVRFDIGNALELMHFPHVVDTVLDCGLFHTFSDEDRPRYVDGLAHVVRAGGNVHILCFSDREPPGLGPRRITQDELREAFADGWIVESIREARFQTIDCPETRTFTPGGPIAWHAIMRKLPT